MITRGSWFVDLCLPFALLIATTGGSLAECKPVLVGMNGLSGPAQADAERVARLNWQFAANQKYGSAYSDWSKAADRKIECQKQTSEGYQCWATARPCE